MKASLPPPPTNAADAAACRAHYESLDMNKNGLPDWTSLVEGRVSSVMYPNDEDMDGDGVDNVLDPDPIDPKVSRSRLAPNGVPAHLALAGEAGRFQGELYREFGILAIDHTDRHVPATLQTLLILLRHGIPPGTRARLTSVRYVYAFLGHDPSVNIAAYHRQVRAVSIGGEASYGGREFDEARMVAVMSSFAHELGHAFLFDTMSASELHRLGTRYGNWEKALDPEPATSFLDQSYFRSHPFRKLARLAGRSKDDRTEFIGKSLWRESSLVSEYATKNLHEWFADSFAAGILHRLGEKGKLGENWQRKLTRLPQHPNGYWVNYNNLSPDFRAWLDERLDATSPATSPDSPKRLGK
jgi:hypothetical protein